MASNGHEATMDSTMDGLIRRSLSTSNAAAQNCPNPEIVASYYERALDPNERAQFETHLSNCARCREQLAIMVRAEEEPSPAVRHTWLWDWRWLAPAVAALLILAAWGVHRSTSPARVPNGKQPLVAMSRPPQAPELNALPLDQPPAESSASAQALVAPKSTDRITSQLQTQQQAKAPQVDQTPQDLQAEKQSPSVNSRVSVGQNEPKVTQKSIDESGAVADLKKAAGNAAAAPAPSAGSPPAVPQPRAADRPSGAPSESPSNSLDTSASNQSIASTNATNASADAAAENGSLGGALGAREAQPRLKAFAAGAGALAQATEQRSGSTIIPTPDPKILWRIAGGNFVERTEDGGATWRGQVADPDAQFTAGSAPTNKTCWLVGKAGVIVVTKDSKQWKKLPPPVPADFVHVEAKNSSSAIVTAADGQKFSTENEGKKWVPAK